MTKLDGKTPDLAAENIEQLRQIFPDVFEEGKIDFDKLKQVLGEYVDDEKERYNFTWNGKGKALRLAQTPTTGTLRPCEAESKNWDDTQNLYIEGDNLEVLKLLQKSYHGKVKMIYIDPPYNTGGDFVYPDDFSDSIENYKRITGQVDDEGKRLGTNSEFNGRYHTDWLNMMYSRLRLARNLLSNDGAIFISIDDNELQNLRKICDEIFGGDQFKGQVTRVTGTPTGQGTDSLVKEADYILIYSKTDEYFFKGVPFSSEDEKIYNQVDEFGTYLVRPLRKTGGEDRREDRPSMYYGVVAPDGTIIYPMAPSGYESRWRCGEDRYKELEAQNLIEWKNVDGTWKVYQKFYLEGRVKQVSNLWSKLEGNKKATIEVKNLLGNGVFDFPKPVQLLIQILQISCNEQDLVLDFFSGSATTAHAVMQLNAQDGGSRKFIMVQLPEPCANGTEAAKAKFENICEIGKERIRRAGEKIKAEIEEQNAQLKIGEEPKKVPDIGFKVFKLDSSNLKQWQPDYDDLETTLFDSISNYVEGRSELDVVYEIMLKMGMELTWPLETHTIGGKNVYEIGMGALMICLDDHITTEVAEGMAVLYKELAPETWRVVFKDNGFADDSAKVNIKEILKTAGLEEDAFTTV